MPEGRIFQQLATEVEFPPLKIVARDFEPLLLPKESKYRPDAIFDLEWQGESRKFVVELKSISTPRALDEAVQQISRYARWIIENCEECMYLPMVMMPYLSPNALDRLVAEGISGIDMSGNGVVTVPGKWFVYRNGAKNRFPSSAPIKNVFRGASSLIPRVLLMRQSFESVGDVLEEIERRGGTITLPTVSKVLKVLEEELLVGREETIRVLDAKRLLDTLTLNYRSATIRRRIRGKVASVEATLPKLMATAKEAGLSLAGNDPTRYAIMPGDERVTTIYNSSIDKLLSGTDFTETNRFPIIELLETDDQLVYFDRRPADGFYWTSPLQNYLELAASGKRERETSEQIRQDLLQFRYEER